MLREIANLSIAAMVTCGSHLVDKTTPISMQQTQKAEQNFFPSDAFLRLQTLHDPSLLYPIIEASSMYPTMEADKPFFGPTKKLKTPPSVESDLKINAISFDKDGLDNLVATYHFNDGVYLDYNFQHPENRFDPAFAIAFTLGMEPIPDGTAYMIPIFKDPKNPGSALKKLIIAHHFPVNPYMPDIDMLVIFQRQLFRDRRMQPQVLKLKIHFREPQFPPTGNIIL